MNVGDIEGFGIQTDRIGRRGDQFIIQTLYRYRLGAIGYFDVHLEVFRKAQKYSSSRTRLNPEQLAQRDVRDLLFARRNFKKSFVHEVNCIDEYLHYNRGSTGSLSRAKIPSTHSWM
jgi:hypothetical protein